jgi:hypothetical protein
MSCMVKPRNKAEGGRKVKRKNCVWYDLDSESHTSGKRLLYL